MMRPIQRLCAIVALLAFTLPGAELLAQSVSTQGNIIRNIVVIPDENEDYILQIKGIFTPQSLSQVRMRHKANSTKMTLILPNTLLDPTNMKRKVVSFDESLPLESVNTTEGYNRKSENPNFQTTLEILSRKVLRTELIEPITSSLLQFRLVDAEKQNRNAKNMFSDRALKSARDRQEQFSAKRQQELEAQKQQTASKTRSDANEIIKQYQKPVVLQLSLINGTGNPKKGYQLSVYLGNMQKKSLERRLGLKMDVVNIANAKRPEIKESTIFYKENYLKAALTLAQRIGGKQRVMPMQNQHEKIGVDVEIYLGTNYR